MSYEDLYWAILNEERREFERLLTEVEPDRCDAAEKHPMDAAAWRAEEPAYVHELAERGFDVDAGVEQGRTPLHKAIYEGHTEVARALVENGASLDIEDNTGKHPLHKAIQQDDYEMAKLLIENGADPTHEDQHGHSPLSSLRVRAEHGDRDHYEKYFDLMTEEQLSREASRTPDPTGLDAGHERVALDGDTDEVAAWLWENLVPPSGQADTIQGELIRAVERLRSEAQRNGNGNWNEHYEMLIDFLETHLCDEDLFSEAMCEHIEIDLNRLRDSARSPYLDDDLYDRLLERVVTFCEHNPELVEKSHDDDLKI